METESSAFLSGFCNYYSVLSGDEEMAVSSCAEPIQGEWCDGVNSTSSHEEVLQYLEYYEECPRLDIITFHELEGSDTVTGSGVPVITSTTDSSADYLTYNNDQGSTPVFLSDPGTSVIDLDCLTDSCPFDWDLNLENLITTKSEALPDLTPLCNDICLEYADGSSEIMASPQQVDDQTSTDPLKPKFQCSFGQCQKVYAKAAHLRSHIRRHLGDKPYICTWENCLWRFNRSDELARHKRSHSGHKPYGCDYCPKRFSRSDHLSKHRKVHERKFASGKAKGVWRVLPKAKPGRKPKALKLLEESQNSMY